MESVYQVDPLKDERWAPFLQQHRQASIFHTPGWLNALRRTYGYEPLAFTDSPTGVALRNAILFCRVRSWLTGGRLVSLPFSDHCEPLVADLDELSALLAALRRGAQAAGCKYIELRPVRASFPAEAGLEESASFCFHTLDLRPDLNSLYGAFHNNSYKQQIRRAEREGLVCEEGRSLELLQKFYSLHVLTRRMHQIPPQPFAWFRNLATCMGEKFKVRVASKDGRPVASVITLQNHRTLVYKYSCSCKASSVLGGSQLLIWKAIQDAKSEGLLEFDLGRSDLDNEGLIRFKDRAGASRSTMTYWRYPPSSSAHGLATWKTRMAKRILSRLPNACFVAAGNLFYRHLG